MNIQQLMLLGRATKDGEVLASKEGKTFGKFSIAVNRYRGKELEEEATFYEVVNFGKNAEQIADKVKKGDLVSVIGRPKAEGYLSKEGEPKAQLKVVAEKWQVLK